MVKLRMKVMNMVELVVKEDGGAEIRWTSRQ